MAWYDLSPIKKYDAALYTAATNNTQPKTTTEDSLGLHLNTTDEEGTLSLDKADLNGLSTIAPSQNLNDLFTLAGQKPVNSINQDTLSQAEDIVNSIGSASFITGSEPNNTTDFMAILHNLRLYNNGNETNNDTAAFYEIINDALEALGIDSESSYAEYYIKELIKAVTNSDKDLTKLVSNGIELRAEDLAELDTNGDGSFLDELKTLSLSDEVLTNARKEITKAQISDEMDSDNDGYITLEEMENSFNRNNTIASLFTDEDGNFDAALFYSVASLVGGEYKVTPMVLLGWFDINNDGIITAEEVQQFKTGQYPDPNSSKDNPVYINAYQKGLDYLNN